MLPMVKRRLHRTKEKIKSSVIILLRFCMCWKHCCQYIQNLIRIMTLGGTYRTTLYWKVQSTGGKHLTLSYTVSTYLIKTYDGYNESQIGKLEYYVLSYGIEAVESRKGQTPTYPHLHSRKC